MDFEWNFYMATKGKIPINNWYGVGFESGKRRVAKSKCSFVYGSERSNWEKNYIVFFV